MKTLAACLVLLVASATSLVAEATRYPLLHTVVGVAADDVLNIRQSPSGDAPILATLPPGKTGVEVVMEDPSGKWGLVNTGEIPGWASLRFLRPDEPGDYALTREIWCLGTEPFWSLKLVQGQSAAFSSPEGSVAPYSMGLLKSAFNHGDRYFTGLGNGDSIILRRDQCSDDMTDRTYGLEIDYLTANPMFGGDPVMLTGCCTISPR